MQSNLASQPAPCVLDIECLSRIEILMGPGKFLNTLEKFKRELDLRVSLIVEAGGDAAETVENAHKLVGTSGLMGLRELCEVCQRLEVAAAAGQHVDLRPHIESVTVAARRARRELELLAPIT
jgi:hypothetical protein